MHESKVLSAIIDTIPQWYSCIRGDNSVTLSFNGIESKLCSHRPLTQALNSLLSFALQQFPSWEAQVPKIPTLSSITKIGEDLAMKWLNLQNPDVNWNKWIAYAEELRQRTHENVSTRRNLIISSGQGTVDITDPNLQNVFDSLTTNPQVYIRVDKNLQFIDYNEILWEEIKDSQEYKFSPEFLQPLISTMKEGEYCAHLSERGDILIADTKGMLASCRKGRWLVYDVEALRDAFVEIIGDYNVGSHLFEVLFDLSYQRQGALLVFDPSHVVIDHVINKQSVMTFPPTPNTGDLARRLLAPRVRSIHMGETSHKLRKKRLFLEVASVDGALIFDTQQVLAFGAMIEFHPNVKVFNGARGAAAQSAHLWGGHSFKVSADGDISVLFRDRSSGMSAELRFM